MTAISLLAGLFGINLLVMMMTGGNEIMKSKYLTEGRVDISSFPDFHLS